MAPHQVAIFQVILEMAPSRQPQNTHTAQLTKTAQHWQLIITHIKQPQTTGGNAILIPIITIRKIMAL